MSRSQIQRTNIDVYRVLSAEIPGKFLDVLRPCGTPHQCLPVRSGLTGYLADLGFETHVQHSVGFVKHQIGDPPAVRDLLPEEINQAARSGNDDFNTFAQILHLLLSVHTTIAAGVLDFGTLAKTIRLLLGLTSQLPCWRKNKYDGTITFAQIGLRINMNNSWQKERQCFAAASLRNADHVAACKSYGPTLNLNWRGLLEASTSNFLENVLWEGRLLKVSHRLWNILTIDDGDVL
mmetsp:Transcript_67159/g.160833  ORF Transcript_67159/g.160833 Transcript_67159/m.160833 type:complete len:235 (-) Transcript_67159:407-1111(-)